MLLTDISIKFLCMKCIIMVQIIFDQLMYILSLNPYESLSLLSQILPFLSLTFNIIGQFSRIWYKSRKLRFLTFTCAQRLVSLCLWYCADAARKKLQMESYFYMPVLNIIDFRG